MDVRTGEERNNTRVVRYNDVRVLIVRWSIEECRDASTDDEVTQPIPLYGY